MELNHRNTLNGYVSFFKALADVNRLKIIGLLAIQPYTVEQLATLLGLGPSTVSHHMSRLSEAGLVTARAESYYSVYSLNVDALEEKSRQFLSKENLPNLAADIDPETFDRKVIRDFSLADGRLKTIPAQRKKLDVILRYIVKPFEPGREYTENEVNEILSRFHEDTATLRRELVGSGLMQRHHGVYWRVDSAS